MTALVVVAGILTGAFAGGCLAMAAAFAVMSRSQERMQRKVRYWQEETARVRSGLGDNDGERAESLPEQPARLHREPWVW
jgi:hypothetical protein